MSVQLDACLRIDHRLFQRLLDAELELAIDYSSDRATGTGSTVVAVQCAPTQARLDLRDGVTGKSMIRVLALPGVTESSRSRWLALAVAEFVAASWSELRIARSSAAASVSQSTTRAMEQRVARFAQKHPLEVAPADALDRPPNEPYRPARTAVVEKPLRLGLGLEIVKIASIGSPLLGLELVGAVRPWPRAQLGLAIQLSRGSIEGAVDGQRIMEITLLSLGAALQLLYVQTIGAFELNAGVETRSGLTWLQVAASSQLTPRRAPAHLTYVPMALLGVSYAVSSELRLGLKLGLGRVLPGVDLFVVEAPGTAAAHQTAVAALRGLWAEAMLAVSWVL